MPWVQGLAWTGALIALVSSPLLLAHASRRGDEGRVACIAGWLALPVSMALFAMVVGPASGIAFVLIGLPLPGLALVWWQRERRPMALQQVRRSVRPRQAPPRGRWLRAIVRAFVALSLALAAALFCAIQLSYLANSMTAGVVTALALVVLLWAVAAWWVFADPKLWRPAGGLLLLALISGLPLWLK
jgi:hypothetical protein